MENIELEREQPNFEETQKNVNDEEINKEENGVELQDDGSLGKFKDAKDLLNAYNNLQAEFTRKCQKLSELEKKDNEIIKNSQNSNLELDLNNKDVIDLINNNKDFRTKVLTSYLEEIQKNQVPQMITKFVGCEVAHEVPLKPKNLSEAKAIIEKMFK